MDSATSRFCRLAATAAAIVFASCIAGADLLQLAAAPRGRQTAAVVQVSSEPELQNAVAALSSGTTIVVAPGTYKLTSTLSIKGGLTNVAITGSTNNPSDVVLVGMGMDNADYGDVPHGLSVGGSVQGITISNLTIRDVFKHAISLEPGSEAPRLNNLRLVDAGRQFVKAYPDGHGGGVDDGILEASVVEYTVEASGPETGAVHVAGGARWVVRGNRFLNFKTSAGGLAAPVILMANGARDSLIERNSFVNCQQEIALGAEDRTPNDHAGGTVRNNFISRDFATKGGPAIQLADSPITQVLHNTILSNTASASLIEYRYTDTAGVVIRNNLLDGQITARDGGTGTVSDNYVRAVPGMFAAPASGDLHLLATAVEVIDQANTMIEASTDFDGDARPNGSAADFGADEILSTTPQPVGSDTSTVTSSTALETTSTSTESSSTSGTITVSGLPEPWQWADVGSPQTAGSATWASSTFTVNAAGADIGGNSDQFTFVYQTLDGDGEIVARVTDLYRTHPWAKAGLMFRDELLGPAKYAAGFVTPEKGLYFQFRIANGSNTTQASGGSDRAPHWLKLSRKGQTFTASASADGVNWTTIGSEAVYLNRLAYVGLAVTSRSWRVLTAASFTNVAVTAAPASNATPQVSLTSPDTDTTCNSPCSMDVTAAATDPDGTITKVDFYAGSTLIGSVNRPPYTLVWKDVPPGIHRLTATAEDDDGATATSPEVQVDVTENQAPTVSLTTPASGASYTAPASIALAATAADADGSIARVDFFSGSTLIASDTTSPYTASLSDVGAGSYTFTAVAHDNTGAAATSAPVSITVNAPVNVPPTVGLTAPGAGSTFTAGSAITMAATASDADGTVAKVEFYAGAALVGTDTTSPYSISWTAATAGTYTLSAKAWDNAGASSISAGVNVTVEPASTLPSPWQTADVGSPVVAGAASYSNGSFTVSGAGSDIWGTSDQFRFVYQPLETDGVIAACVKSLDFVDEWTKAGVMVRQSLAPDAPYAYAMLSAGWGVTLQHRIAAGQAATGIEPVPGVAPHCIRLVRKGTTFTAYQSLDGSAWAPMGSVTISIGSTMLVGLAVTSHNTTTAAKAVFEQVTLGPAPANQAPSVSLTAPAAGASFTAPATITLTATASDGDGIVTGVDFYAGKTLVGSDTSSPYSVTWSGVPAGSYSLTAVARDDSGATATSAPISITVENAPNQAPVVSITSPASGATFTLPVEIIISATASDPDGSISKVDFYAGTVLVGSDSTSPYAGTWTNTVAGTHTLTAVAYDNSGASTTSAPITISISSGNKPPSVSLTSPTAGATFAAPATITLTASASDADGSIASVEFYAGSTRVGSDTTSPYSVSWSNVPAGSYTLKAVAKDNVGATTASASVSISVGAVVAAPKYVVFTASADHSTNVTSYTVEFFAAGADPATTKPVSVQNIGKPAPVNGDITVDVNTTVQALPAGSYFSTVSAHGSGGSSRSAPSATFVR